MSETARTSNEFSAFLDEKKDDLQRLRSTIYGLLEACLRSNRIEFLSIQSRVKESSSALKKADRKGYKDPRQDMTDIVGARIIIYLERDIDKANQAIRKFFEIDEKNSVDKRIPERAEEVGYRSLHLVCSLGEKRETFPEYTGLTDIRFEVQIRTVLQHAWAEIEHKRNYKGPYALPKELQHRLMTVSGALELVDREFSQIASEADEYTRHLSAAPSEMAEDKLSLLAMREVLKRAIDPNTEVDDSEAEVLEELHGFGIETVRDLIALLDEAKPERIKRITNGRNTAMGVIRIAMMIVDADRYFTRAHKYRWQNMSQRDLNLLKNFSGNDHIRDILESNGVEIILGE